MKKMLIISTGGTFNKVYNPISGDLEIDKESISIKKIAKEWLSEFEIINIIGKDSLDMSNIDREEIVKSIKKSGYKRVIIVHGTDTIDKTAQYLQERVSRKIIVLTGAMTPFSINPIEATANLASAYGYINAIRENGIYISMNGIIDIYNKVIKNRRKGYFELQKGCNNILD
jgi:L-asparaginase